MQTLEHDIKDYYETIGKVSKIDISAAQYLRDIACLEQDIEKFDYDADISQCFYWYDTPQGFDFWENIYERLNDEPNNVSS